MNWRLRIVDSRLTFVDVHRWRCRALLAIVAACLFAILACERKPIGSTQPAASQPRIVSLSPALSRTLIDLGLGGSVVGRTPYCSSLDQSIPVVGDLQTIDYEALVRLNPTHILVQPPAGGVDAHLAEVARQYGWAIADWQLNSLDDIRSTLREIPERLYATQSPERSDVSRRASDLLAHLDSAVAPANQQPPYRGRTLMVSAVDPVMAFGSGTYLDDVLRALGGVNAVSDRGWVQLSLEDVVRLAPAGIILVKPGAMEVDLPNDLGPLATIDAPANSSGHRALLAHQDAFLPSSSVAGVAEQLRSILTRFAESATASDNRP